MARVSVVMPFLNASRYLGEAIDSVVAQTFPDWQLVLVDDGSTDGSIEIAAEYAAGFPERIRLLHADPARKGAAAARNRGIAASAGDFVAFLDADDLYMPSKLAADVSALDSDPQAAWVYGATRWFYEDGSRRSWTERPGVRLDRRYDPPELLVRILIEERGDVPCTCGVMIRRDPLTAVGGFEEMFDLYEDQSLWAKLLLDYPVRVSSGCRSLYRQHPRAISAIAATEGAYDRKGPHPARDAFLEWLVDYLVARGSSAEVIASAEAAIALNQGGLGNRLRRKLRRLSRFLH